MPLIVERIHRGESASDIGIPEIQYNSWKQTLEEFLLSWDGNNFEPSFRVWALEKEQEESESLGVKFTPNPDFDPVKAEEAKNGKIVTCGDPLPDTPSLTTRAGNLSKALFRWAVEGLPVESKESASARVAICETNECGFYDGSICRHQKCGCFSKIKTFLTTEHCPLGKW